MKTSSYVLFYNLGRSYELLGRRQNEFLNSNLKIYLRQRKSLFILSQKVHLSDKYSDSGMHLCLFIMS